MFEPPSLLLFNKCNLLSNARIDGVITMDQKRRLFFFCLATTSAEMAAVRKNAAKGNNIFTLENIQVHTNIRLNYDKVFCNADRRKRHVSNGLTS